MARINLLPWRQERRDEQKKEFQFVAIGFAIASILIIVYMHNHYSSKIEAQDHVNKFLKNEIKVMDKRIADIKDIRKKKDELIARLEVIQSLQQNRPAVVLLFDSMVKILPDGVHYERISRKEDNLNFSGEATSNSAVSQLMRNIDETKILTNPSLSVIKAKKKSGSGLEVRTYKLDAKQLNPFKEQKEEDDEA